MATYSKILIVALGTVAIIWGNLSGVTFYPGGLGIVNRTKPIPKWFGRLWFSVFGLWLIYMGLAGSTPVIVERVIAVGLGVAIILSGLGAWRKNQPASPGVSLGISPERRPFRGFLFLVVGIGFIIGGLLLIR